MTYIQHILITIFLISNSTLVLSMDPKTVREIAARTGLDEYEVRRREKSLESTVILPEEAHTTLRGKTKRDKKAAIKEDSIVRDFANKLLTAEENPGSQEKIKLSDEVYTGIVNMVRELTASKALSPRSKGRIETPTPYSLVKIRNKEELVLEKLSPTLYLTVASSRLAEVESIKKVASSCIDNISRKLKNSFDRNCLMDIKTFIQRLKNAKNALHTKHTGGNKMRQINTQFSFLSDLTFIAERGVKMIGVFTEKEFIPAKALSPDETLVKI